MDQGEEVLEIRELGRRFILVAQIHGEFEGKVGTEAS
jgi:hypothetical protein